MAANRPTKICYANKKGLKIIVDMSTIHRNSASQPISCINCFPTKLSYFNFHPLEVVSRYRDPQLQVGEDYSYLFKFGSTIHKFECLTLISFQITVI